MKKNNMLTCAVILAVSFVVFRRLLKKPGESYPRHWKEEAEDAVEWTKNFLQEKRNDFS